MYRSTYVHLVCVVSMIERDDVCMVPYTMLLGCTKSAWKMWGLATRAMVQYVLVHSVQLARICYLQALGVASVMSLSTHSTNNSIFTT